MKIGKLRIMQSGKVVLRIFNESGEKGEKREYIDMDVSQGITNNFYQELVTLNRQKENEEKISFLSKLQNKLVVTPDLD